MIIANSAYAQTKSATGLAFRNGVYDVFVICIDTQSIKQLSIVENTTAISHTDFIAQNFNPAKISFAMSLAINEDHCTPTGLYISDGKEISNINSKDGSSNFYKKPNGALIITNKEAKVLESSKISAEKNIRYAFQSGPMLITDNRIHPEFQPNSKNKTIRSGVGVFTKGNKTYLVFAISENSVKFYEFASFLKETYGCKNALYLGGGKCAMFAAFLNRNNPSDADFFCRYITYK